MPPPNGGNMSSGDKLAPEDLMNQNQTNENMFHLLIETENQQISKLNEIVANSLKEEKLLTHKLLRERHPKLTISAKVADVVARFGGSWSFILASVLVITCWIAINVWAFTATHFDPYPFTLLNLLLSMVAALQAPVILMSQNRQEAKDRQRAEHDYLINLKAELEVRTLHEKIDHLILARLKVLVDTQQKQLEILQSLSDERK